jgi:hypothetical protein
VLVVSTLAGCTIEPKTDDASDTRAACPSTVNLDDAAKTFKLVLPADATAVHFASSVGGMGGKALTLVFDTTPSGLDEFVTASHLSAPTGTKLPQPLFAGEPKCGLDDGFTYSAVLARDEYVPSTARSMAVDLDAPGAPRVLVVASTL